MEIEADFTLRIKYTRIKEIIKQINILMPKSNNNDPQQICLVMQNINNVNEYNQRLNVLSNESNQYRNKIEELDKKINDLKEWTDTNYTPRNSSGGGDTPSQYVTQSDLNTASNNLKDWTNANYVPRNSVSDLSLYAKIADVNTAFSQLSTAIEGV